jgi:exodeoxyribonuclease V beta subunit
VTALLAAGTIVRPRDGGAERELGPGDLAVLVRTNKQAELVRCVLQEAGVPVVLTGRSDVFATRPRWSGSCCSRRWSSPTAPRACAGWRSAPFVGRTAEQLAVEDSEALGLSLRCGARVLEDRGVAALFEAVCLAEAVQPRLLRSTGGDACSPTCATSPRRCTRPRSRDSSA